MTIQLSVTLWTILCFLALMVILDRLLFRPMLSFMDARRAKIEAARAVREESAAAREAELERREASRREAAQKAQTAETQKLETTSRAIVRAVDKRKAENARWLEAMSSGLDQESDTIRRQLEPLMDEMAVAFANRLLVWQDQSKPEDRLRAESFPTIE